MAILMSIHNIGFYEDLTKVIIKYTAYLLICMSLSMRKLFICFIGTTKKSLSFQLLPSDLVNEWKIMFDTLLLFYSG